MRDNTIQTPRFWERLRRSMELKGPEASTLHEATVPVVVVADMELPEYAFLERRIQYLGGSTRAALAGNFGRLSLRPDPATCTIVDWVMLSMTAQSRVRVGMAGVVTTNVGAVLPFEGRARNGTAISIASIRGQDAAANVLSAPSALNVVVAANTPLFVPLGWQISTPSNINAVVQELVVECQTINTGIDVSFAWSERPWEQSEVS